MYTDESSVHAVLAVGHYGSDYPLRRGYKVKAHVAQVLASERETHTPHDVATPLVFSVTRPSHQNAEHEPGRILRDSLSAAGTIEQARVIEARCRG